MKRNFCHIAVSFVLCSSSVAASTRTLEFQTTQVTSPDVAVSPDGQTLVFTMLGHLFSLPSVGGTAEQLTFGPYYDNDPIFSPDGSQVAFTSDRDGSDGNIFVLTLRDRQLRQLTHEARAGRSAWSPDGKAIMYLRYEHWTHRGWPAAVSRIPSQGGQAEIVTAPPRLARSLFFLPDGRLAWAVIERDNQSSAEVTRVEVLSSQGTLSTLRTIPGSVDRVLASPDGNGLYCHRVNGPGFVPISEDVSFVPIPEGSEKEIVPVSSIGRFALSTDGKSLYVGDQGHLWKVLLPAGGSQALSLQAHVKLETEEVSKPYRPPVEERNVLRAILAPRLSPDGSTLVFGAVGFLWRQRLDGGKAQRISQDTALESEPAFSPDGHQLAFVHTEHGEDSVRLFDLVTGQTRVLTSGPSISQLAWSSNGQRLIAVVTAGFDSHVTSFSIADGKSEPFVEAGFWSPRPQFSFDGRILYYSSDTTGVGNLYRLQLSKDAKPEQVTHLARHLSDARISPDGKWLVFRRNRSILTASLTGNSIRDADVHELSIEGGDSFALAPDGASVIYSVGRRVWRQPLTGGPRQEIPVSLELQPSVPPPLLLRGVRVLDLVSGSFGPPVSLLLENAKIQWIGSETGHSLPKGTSTVEATGRFAIPGLFDFHAHSVGANEEAFLAYGVTSLRDTGDSLASLNALKDRSEFTGLPLPRYFYSGEIFEGDRPWWGDGFLQIDNEQDARDYVRHFKEWGANFIKVYPTLSWPLKRAVSDEAHRLGLPVVGHGTHQEEITKSVTLGFFSLEHATSPDPVFDDVLQMLAASGTRWDPTVAVMGGDSLLLRDEPERLVDAKFKAFTPLSYIDFARSGGYNKAVSTDALRGSLSALLSSIARAHRLGVNLLVGTDAPNPECFFGSSLHWELARFVEAGLSPAEVLRLATEGGATSVGAEDLGALAPGKLADIVLLQANPLENIHNTEGIWRVIKGGWIFDPEKLPKTPNPSPTSGKTVAPGGLPQAQK